MASHVWMDNIGRLKEFEFRNGDVVQFDALIRKYVKGRRGENRNGKPSVMTEDYELVYPSKICILWRRLSKVILKSYDVLY